MKLEVPFNKENIKILKNIKNDNEVNFKVHMEDKIIEIFFDELRVSKDHYINIDESFIDLLIDRAKSSTANKKIHKKNDTYIIKEITEKIISLKLNVENTVAIEKLLEKHPDKTQTSILNDLIKKGLSNKS